MTNRTETVTIYPDTLAGVLEMLNAESDLTLTREDVAEFEADFHVDGVWRLELKEPSKHNDVVEMIVYLAGYENPWGDKREDNDWECGYADEDDDLITPMPEGGPSEPDEVDLSYDAICDNDDAVDLVLELRSSGVNRMLDGDALAAMNVLVAEKIVDRDTDTGAWKLTAHGKHVANEFGGDDEDPTNHEFC